MIWLNFDTWYKYKIKRTKNKVWYWERYYKNGHRWTPFIILKIKTNENLFDH